MELLLVILCVETLETAVLDISLGKLKIKYTTIQDLIWSLFGLPILFHHLEFVLESFF